jgi:hypothetical protein
MSALAVRESTTVEAFAFGFLLGSLPLSLYVVFLLLLSNTTTAFLD